MVATSITRVAIKFKGKVYSLSEPYRHHHIIRYLSTTPGTQWSRYLDNKHVQGFVTNDGRFVNRKQAFTIAHKSEQTLIGPFFSEELYSENLWGSFGERLAPPGTKSRQLWEYTEDPDVVDSKILIQE